MQSEQINEIATALAAAQAEMANAPLNRVNPHFRSKYADLASVRDATIPALSKHGLAILQTTTFDANYNFELHTTMTHSSGQFFRSFHPLPSNVKPQELGSALTYARRYAWQSICGISADDDDDGNAAQDAKPTANSNGNARQPRRTRAEISAHAQHKTRTHDGILEDLRQIETTVALDALKRELTPELMASLGNAQFLIEEAVAAKEIELSAPAEDEPGDQTAEEDRMNYVRDCLAIIEEAKTRPQLAEWWKGQSGKRRELDLTATQLKGLMDEVAKKRDSLPGYERTGKPYGTGMVDKDGREMSVLEAG